MTASDSAPPESRRMRDEPLLRFTTSLSEPPPVTPRTAIRRYLVAIVTTAAAVAATVLVPSLWQYSSLVLPLTAVLVSAWYGGHRPGLLSAGFSVAGLVFFAFGPLSPAGSSMADDALRLALFAGLAYLAVALAANSQSAEQLMREQWDMCRVTLTSIGDAVMVTDTDADVTFMNEAAETLTGWRRSEAFGRPLAEVFNIVNEASRQVVDNPVSRVVREGVVVGLANHTMLIARDGTQRPIDDSGAPIRDRSGRIIGVVLVFRDVTERKRAEAEREDLLARERLARLEAEAANRAKDEFLATVSHELRTPLTAILGWTAVLHMAPSNPELTGRALETIERNATAQARIIDDILDVSRIITGRLYLDVRPVDLVSVIGAVIDTIRPAAEAKSIAISSSLDPAAGPVLGDATRLQQVVWNVLSNAVKFTPKDGRMEVALSRRGSNVVIQVRDSGQGIPPHLLTRVFERFSQVEGGTTRRQGGLGLGLAIARHLVELHGGTIQAESAGEGRGAMFTISLPLRPAVTTAAPEPATPLAAPDFPSLAGIRLLVVEDEPDNQALLVHVLERCGARVVGTSSVAEAREALRGEPFDMLLSDLHLRGEDGYALIRHVRQLPAESGGRMPAAALTAYARPEDRRRVLEAGFSEHVSKPVDLVQLARLIARLVGREPNAPERAPGP
jgi:PAS domain S-box-containing protein